MDFFKLIESLKEITISYEETHNHTNEINRKLDDPLPVIISTQSPNNSDSKSSKLESSGFHDELSIVAETHTSKNVSFSVYLSYILGGGSVWKILFILFICLLTQLLCTSEDNWISYW